MAKIKLEVKNFKTHPDKIRDLVQGKPSVVVRAMINGLEKAQRRKSFVVDMWTYFGLDDDEKVCVGCAATCALQELTGINLVYREVKHVLNEYNLRLLDDSMTKLAKIFQARKDDIYLFEKVVDRLRSGYVGESNNPVYLYGYCRMPIPQIQELEKERESLGIILPPLEGSTQWPKNLRHYRRFARFLEARGL